jgi:hypothetical protein
MTDTYEDTRDDDLLDEQVRGCGEDEGEREEAFEEDE